MLDLCCCMGFFLVAESRCYSLTAVCGLLVVASLVAEHRLQGALDSVLLAPELQSRDSMVGCKGLAAPKHVGSSPTRDGTCVSLHGQADSLSLESPAKPKELFFFFSKEVFLTRNKFLLINNQLLKQLILFEIVCICL